MAQRLVAAGTRALSGGSASSSSSSSRVAVVPNRVRVSLQLKVTSLDPLMARVDDEGAVDERQTHEPTRIVARFLSSKPFRLHASVVPPTALEVGSSVVVDGELRGDGFHAAFVTVLAQEVERDLESLVKRACVRGVQDADETTVQFDVGLPHERRVVACAARRLQSSGRVDVSDDGVSSREVARARASLRRTNANAVAVEVDAAAWGPEVARLMRGGRHHVVVHAPFASPSDADADGAVRVVWGAHFVDGWHASDDAPTPTIWIGNAHVARVGNLCSPLTLSDAVVVADSRLVRFARSTRKNVRCGRSMTDFADESGVVVVSATPWTIESSVGQNVRWTASVRGDEKRVMVARVVTAAQLVRMCAATNQRPRVVRVVARGAVKTIDVVVAYECAAQRLEVVGDLDEPSVWRILSSA